MLVIQIILPVMITNNFEGFPLVSCQARETRVRFPVREIFFGFVWFLIAALVDSMLHLQLPQVVIFKAIFCTMVR